MKTKQQILYEANWNGVPFRYYKHTSLEEAMPIIGTEKALSAMDKYAKQIAIEFAEWNELNGWKRTPKIVTWVKERHENGLTDYVFKSTAELFDQFMLECIKI